MSLFAKEQVRAFWDAAACGEVYAIGDTPLERYNHHSQARYSFEPYIRDFARFHEGIGKAVLEVGVGFGADHAEWAKSAPVRLVGVDISQRAVDSTKERLSVLGLSSELYVADAERLPFRDDSFDHVYSWGVVHHSPDTEAAVAEIHRVLRPGGRARVMIYHSPSIVGLLLWGRYALLAGQPRTSMAKIYAEHLESPGTKAYSLCRARHLFGRFRDVRTRSQIGFGDLLQGEVGQMHGGIALAMAKKFWPRAVIGKLHPLGLMLLVEARK